MKRYAIGLAIAAVALSAAQAKPAKPVKKAPAKPKAAAKAPAAAKQKPRTKAVAPAPADLEPDVQFRRPGKAAPAARPSPRTRPAANKKPAAARPDRNATPLLPSGGLTPSEEAAQYEEEMRETGAEIDRMLDRLDKAGNHKSAKGVTGARILAARHDRMTAILKDEQVSQEDQEKLRDLSRRLAHSAYLYSTSLVLMNRDGEAIEYLREIVRSAPADSHLGEAAGSQLRSLRASP